MSKKSFKNNNPALAFITQPTQEEQLEGQLIYGDKGETQEQQVKQDTQEAPREQGTYKKHPTQGRKGQKLPRINMAFSNDNLEYLQIISRIEGVSITQYVNNLIEADRGVRADDIERAKGILKGVD